MKNTRVEGFESVTELELGYLRKVEPLGGCCNAYDGDVEEGSVYLKAGNPVLVRT